MNLTMLERFKYIASETFNVGSAALATIKVGGAAMAFMTGFFMPIYHFLLIVGVLVGADFITGAWKARKKGEKFTSGGMKRTVEKTALYFIAVLASYGMEWVFIAGGPEPWKYGLTYAVSGFIASTEFKSILENVASITGINLWDKIKDRLSGWLGNDKPNEQNGG